MVGERRGWEAKEGTGEKRDGEEEEMTRNVGNITIIKVNLNKINV